MSWYDLDLTFDLAVMTIYISIFFLGNIKETVRCKKLIFDRSLVGECIYANAWYGL